MEFHVITPRGAELVAQVADGKLVIVPPPKPPKPPKPAQPITKIQL